MNRKLRIFLILLAAAIVLTLTLVEIRKTVAIVIEKDVYTTHLWGFTTADALKAAEIPLSQGDEITPALDEWIQENEIIRVQRAAWVVITKGSDQHALWTVERKPASLLETAGVDLNSGDELYSNGAQVELNDPLPYMPIRTIEVHPATPISVHGEDGIGTFTSSAASLGSALWQAGHIFYTADRITPALQTPLTGEEITAEVERSQEVAIISSGTSFVTRVLADTVGEALTAADVPLQGLNYSIPPEDEPLPSDGQIEIVQVREEFILEQEFLPFGIEYVPSAEVDLDTQQILQTGEYGIQAQRIRVLYENDQEISREIAESWTAKSPIPRQVGYGTKITVQTLNTPVGPIEYYRAVDAYATSYSPCRIGVAGQCSSRTASGAELKKGVIGVIRSWYNSMKGARVYIPGYGIATIEDIGAGFSDRHWVDLGYSDDDWVRWSGYVTVYFLTPVPANILYILD